jgi:hypothetical protein
MFMLLFAGCNNDHTAPCNNKWWKYAKGEYSKYAKDGMYSAKGEYSKKSKEDASVKEGYNKPLAKEGDNKPLERMATALGTTMSPSPQRQLAAYVMHDDDKSLATRASDHVHCARQQ